MVSGFGSGPARLAPHPWDALPASPPAPGGDYLDALDPLPIRDALNARRLVVAVTEAEREVERAEERLGEAEDDLDTARAAMRKALDPIADRWPAFANEIENGDGEWMTESDVREAARLAGVRS